MSTSTTALLPRIESRIQMIRGQRVMIDVDLAELYGVQTKRLNEQVKRNRERFPSDFLFQLTIDENTEMVVNCDLLQKLTFSKVLPFAFTENCVDTVGKIKLEPHVCHTCAPHNPNAGWLELLP